MPCTTLGYTYQYVGFLDEDLECTLCYEALDDCLVCQNGYDCDLCEINYALATMWDSYKN